MECTCVRHTDLPHTTRLFGDYLYHYDKVSSYYSYPPFDFESYRRSAGSVEFSSERRAKLVRALSVHNGASESLAMLARPGTVAVVTGQQVGLYTGPAYTIYKALTAVKLARDLTAAGIPAVPIFWLATEDHDFAEIDHCWVFDDAHRPLKLQAAGAEAAGQAVGTLPLTTTPDGELESALARFPEGPAVAGLVSEAYRSGLSFGDGFRRLLGALLPGHQPLFVDPMLPAFRAMAAPTLRAALAAAPDLHEAVLRRNRDLQKAGYHAQVHIEPDTSLVFLLDGFRRLALKRNGREYFRNGRRLSTSELLDRAETLSPNALLRPVVQDSMLPTVAYVGGPAELAYLAQAQVVYQALLRRMPVAVSRAGFTLLDRRSRKLLDRYRLRLADFFHGHEALTERMARSLTPESLGGQIQAAKGAVNEAVERLDRALGDFDPTLQAAFQKSRRKIEYQLTKTERKVARQMMLRDERAAADARYLRGLIYPEKHLQERLYSILPFVARHGLDLIPELYENIRLDCPDHRLMVL